MTGDPQGTSAPLDLAIVERHLLQHGHSDTCEIRVIGTASGTFSPECTCGHSGALALLVHCRALRAALEQTLGTYHDTDMDGTHRGDYDPTAPPCARCLAEERATAVLGAAQDGPA